jgi:hypothetical protein
MTAPTKNDVIGSLKAAADIAHSAFTTAAMIDPVAAKPLWVDSISLTNTYLAALQQSLADDPVDIQTAKDALDAQTKATAAALDTLKDVTTAIATIAKLLDLATTVAKFLV